MHYVLIYMATLVAANLVVAWFGPAVTPIVAFVLIGLDLSLRDRLHDLWQGRNLWPRMILLITSAGLVSYMLNPASGAIAVASVFAFGLASLADGATYQALVQRSWTQRANCSNLVGGAVDSLIFPLLAFGALMPSIIVAQLAAKVIGGMVWVYLISRFGSTAASKPA